MTVADAPPKAATPVPVGTSTDTRKQGRLAAILLTPTMAVLAIVIGFPILAALYQSLFIQGQGVDADGFIIEGDQFVGIGNYVSAFAGEAGPRFLNALINTTFF